MKELTKNSTAINLISAALIVVMIALCCVGYISTGEGDYSIIGYVYLPDACGGLTDYCEANIDGFTVNDAVGTPLWVLCIGAIMAVLCIWKRDNSFLSIGTLVWSVVGLIGYCTSAFLKLGGMYWLHVAVLAVTALVAVLGVLGIKDAMYN